MAPGDEPEQRAAGRRAARYALSVGRALVLAVLSDAYDGLVREAKDDDRLTGSPDALGQAGYPPLAVVLEDPELALDVVGHALEADLLAAVLPPAAGMMRGTWAIDTVDAVRADGGRVMIEGTCYRF
ncbi:MAG: hypothetical protein ACJ8GN_31430 [Longimicrobiaceae bacterium]